MANVHCDWEPGDFDEGEFDPYMGKIQKHKRKPLHLTNGLLIDGEVPTPTDDGRGFGLGPTLPSPAPDE